MGRILDLFINKYNYTDFHELNLDWIISDLRTLADTLENFISLNTIKYANPIQWNITTQYEANTVVIDANDGTAYLSVKPVPSGVALSNTDYWTPIFTLNLLSANQNITLRDDSSNVLATFASDAGDWLIWNSTLYKVSQSIAINEAYVPGYNLDRYSVELFLNDAVDAINNTIGELEDLNTTDQTSVVNAINEVLTNIGTLSDLNTTDKSSIVNAINEVADNISNVPIIINYAKYGIIGNGNETDKFDLVLADLEDNHHYIFDNTTIHVAWYSDGRTLHHSNITIEGLNIDGTVNPKVDPSAADYTGEGFYISGNNIKFKNCSFKNMYQTNIIEAANNITFDGCHFDTCGYSILQLRGYSSNNGIVTNCIFEHNTQDAIELNCDSVKSYNWTISNNICTGYDDFPTEGTEKRFVGITNVEKVVVTGNIAYNIDGDSIVHIENDANDISITDNIFGEFVGLAAILCLANTTVTDSPRRILVSGNMFNSSTSNGNYRKFIQANSSVNSVKVFNNTFKSTLPYNEMGIQSGNLNNPFIQCEFNMPNYDGGIPQSTQCVYIVKGQNDLGTGNYNENKFITTNTPSIKRTTTAGVSRPWGYSTFMNNVLNHAIQINDAFHSVIKDNYVSTDGETNNFSGINITPTSTSTIKDNFIAGL